MAWIGALVAAGGAVLSSQMNKSAADGMKYQPWNTSVGGIGSANFNRGQLNLRADPLMNQQNWKLNGLQTNALNRYATGQDDSLGTGFLRNSYTDANYGDFLNLSQLNNAVYNPNYNSQDFMSGVNNGLLSNFDPNAASLNYTNLLRQQAQPQEQQAASSALSNLYNTGRLGSTGGQQAYGNLINQQNQADIGRQVAGQQFGLQQQLQAQQGYDAARANQQGLMLNNFGANSQYANNQYQRQLDLYTNSNTSTQDRFNRALQLFGGENANNQQDLTNFMSLLGAQQSNNQQLLDVGRLGASVGQAQTTANANAAMYRNQGNQDMLSGFLGAVGSYYANKKAVG